MNVFSFTGNIGQDAELRYTRSQKAVCTFSVAVKSGYGQNAKTNWVRCTLWETRAEKLAEYLVKGTAVAISGELEIRDWQNEQSGKSGREVEVRVNELQLFGKRSDNTQPNTPSPAPQQSAPGQFEQFDDDIPFD